MTKKQILIGLFLLFAVAALGYKIVGYLDMSLMAAPISPASGYLRTWADTTAHAMLCKDSSGVACYFASAPGGSTGGTNSQTTGYTAVSGDTTQLITFACGSPCTLTLPASPPSSTWWIDAENTGSSNVTVSRNGLNIDGAATNLTLTQNQGVVIYTDGTNYFTQRGMGASSLTLQTNTVNNGSQTLLNLKDSATVTVADDGVGGISFTASGGGGSGSIFPSVVTPPTSGSWTWVPSSQGGSTLNTINGNLVIAAPVDATGVAWRMVYVTAPSPPFTIYAGIYGTAVVGNYAGFGVFTRQSSTGKMVVHTSFTESGSIKWAATTQSAYNVGVTNYYDVQAPGWANVMWFKFQDDKGTSNNYIFSVSYDGGSSWLALGTASRTNYLTADADQIGFCVRANASFAANGALYSWNVTTP